MSICASECFLNYGMLRKGKHYVLKLLKLLSHLLNTYCVIALTLV